MGGYTARRRVKIDGVTYNEGDEIPSGELMPFYFKNLVRRGHVSETEVTGVDEEAVTEIVNGIVADLVDAAPETLNTLNELAAAVADDPNFSSTVTSHISGNGSDHSFIDQDVTSGSSPTFDDANITGVAATHVTSDGSDHTFIDQDVTSGAAPVLDATNFTNLPASGATDIDGLSDATLDAADNLFLGPVSPTTIGTAAGNIVLSSDGTSAAIITDGDDSNVIIGNAITPTGVGSSNVVIGDGAQPSTSMQNHNVIIGSGAFTSGDGGVVAIGTGASANNNYTTAVGNSAIASSINGTAFGYNANGNGGTAIGDGAVAKSTSTSVGSDAGHTAAEGTAIGAGAHAAATGTGNVAVGVSAANTLTSGTYNVTIGHSSNTDAVTRNESIVVGHGLTSGAEDGSIAIGSSTVPGNVLRVESGALTVGGSSVGGATDLDGLSDVEFDGAANLYVGGSAPGTITTAANNLAISSDGTALANIVSQNHNVVIGNGSAGAGITSNAGYAVLIGYGADSSNKDSCVVIGRSASTTYPDTVAIGYNAEATGSSGVAIGLEAAAGTNSVFVGGHAGSAGAGQRSVGVGRGALQSATGVGADNTAVGYNSGNIITSGDRNVAIGYDADFDINTRNDAVVIGAGITGGAEDGSIAIGSSTVPGNVLRVESGVLTVGGSSVGGATDIDGLSDAGLDAFGNIYLGSEVPGTASGANNNIAISGNGGALAALTGADGCIAIGKDALEDLTSGISNVAIGSNTARNITTGAYNLALGTSALGDGSALTGDGNIGIGFEALEAISTTDANNVGLGHQAAVGAVGASGTTALGASVAATLTSGDNNTLVGKSADVDSATRADVVVIGQGVTSGAEDGSIAIGSSTVPGNIIRVESGVLTVGGESWISLNTLKAETAAATDFADFQSRIAAL